MMYIRNTTVQRSRQIQDLGRGLVRGLGTEGPGAEPCGRRSNEQDRMNDLSTTFELSRDLRLNA